MATRKAVAASLASAVIFSSLLISNFVIFSGAAQNFRLLSLAAEGREYYNQAFVVRSVALLDLIDGAQDLLSSRHFNCANASSSVGQLLSAERVRVGWDGLSADAILFPGPDETLTDNLTALHPFNGSTKGWTNMETVAMVQGESPDGSVVYSKTEKHLLNLPLRLRALTEHCLLTYTQVSFALSSLGPQLCNASVLAQTMSSIAGAASRSAQSEGFSILVSYGIASTQPCKVVFGIQAEQENILGPEGAFKFSEEQSGYAVG